MVNNLLTVSLWRVQQRFGEMRGVMRDTRNINGKISDENVLAGSRDVLILIGGMAGIVLKLLCGIRDLSSN